MKIKFLFLLLCVSLLTMCASVSYSTKIKMANTPTEITDVAKSILTDDSLSQSQKQDLMKELAEHTIDIIKNKLEKAKKSSPKEAKELLAESWDIINKNKGLLIDYAPQFYKEVSAAYVSALRGLK